MRACDRRGVGAENRQNSKQVPGSGSGSGETIPPSRKYPPRKENNRRLEICRFLDSDIGYIITVIIITTTIIITIIIALAQASGALGTLG